MSNLINDECEMKRYISPIVEIELIEENEMIAISGGFNERLPEVDDPENQFVKNEHNDRSVWDSEW